MEKVESAILVKIIDYCINRMDDDDYTCDCLNELVSQGFKDARLQYAFADRVRFENRKVFTDIIKIISTHICANSPLD